MAMMHKIARYLLPICFLIFLLYSCLILSPCYFDFLYKNSSNSKTVRFAIAALYVYIILFFIFLPLDRRTASGIDMMYYITDTIWDSYRVWVRRSIYILFPLIFICMFDCASHYCTSTLLYRFPQRTSDPIIF